MLVPTQPTMPASASAANAMMKPESNQSFELPSSRKMVRQPRPVAMKAMPIQSACASIFSAIFSLSRPHQTPKMSSRPGTQLI